MAGIAHLFVRAYSTKMHGGCLRFQAQYLRRIRLPRWGNVAPDDQQRLISASVAKDASAVLAVVGRIYRLSDENQLHMKATG